MIIQRQIVHSDNSATLSIHHVDEGLERKLSLEFEEQSTKQLTKVQRTLLLNVIIGERTPILKLLTGKDEALLVWGDAFLVLNLRLHVVNRVRRLHLQRDGLARESLDEDLHTTAQTKNQMKCRLLLDIVVGKSTTIFQLLSSEDEALLVWGNPFLVLDLRFHIVNSVGRLHFQRDSFPGESLYEDLHATTETKDYGKIRTSTIDING